MNRVTKSKCSKEQRLKKIKSGIFITCLLLCVGYISFLFFRWPLYRHLLKNESAVIIATVTNKWTTGGGHIDPEYIYYYEFTLNGRSYSGLTRDPQYSPGDNIRVKYYPPYPSINEAWKEKQ